MRKNTNGRPNRQNRKKVTKQPSDKKKGQRKKKLNSQKVKSTTSEKIIFANIGVQVDEECLNCKDLMLINDHYSEQNKYLQRKLEKLETKLIQVEMENERYFQRCNYLNQKEKTLLLEIHDLKLQAQSNNVNRRKKSQDAYSFEPHFLRRSHHQFQDSKKHNCKESHHDKPYYRRHRY